MNVCMKVIHYQNIYIYIHTYIHTYIQVTPDANPINPRKFRAEALKRFREQLPAHLRQTEEEIKYAKYMCLHMMCMTAISIFIYECMYVRTYFKYVYIDLYVIYIETL